MSRLNWMKKPEKQFSKRHTVILKPLEPGQHTLTLVDEFGETVSQRFEIIGKKEKK